MVHKVDLPRLRQEAVEGLSFQFSWLKHPTKATVSSKYLLGVIHAVRIVCLQLEIGV